MKKIFLALISAPFFFSSSYSMEKDSPIPVSVVADEKIESICHRIHDLSFQTSRNLPTEEIELRSKTERGLPDRSKRRHILEDIERFKKKREESLGSQILNISRYVTLVSGQQKYSFPESILEEANLIKFKESVSQLDSKYTSALQRIIKFANTYDAYSNSHPYCNNKLNEIAKETPSLSLEEINESRELSKFLDFKLSETFFDLLITKRKDFIEERWNSEKPYYARNQPTLISLNELVNTLYERNKIKTPEDFTKLAILLYHLQKSSDSFIGILDRNVDPYIVAMNHDLKDLITALDQTLGLKPTASAAYHAVCKENYPLLDQLFSINPQLLHPDADDCNAFYQHPLYTAVTQCYKKEVQHDKEEAQYNEEAIRYLFSKGVDLYRTYKSTYDPITNEWTKLTLAQELELLIQRYPDNPNFKKGFASLLKVWLEQECSPQLWK